MKSKLRIGASKKIKCSDRDLNPRILSFACVGLEMPGGL